MQKGWNPTSIDRYVNLAGYYRARVLIDYKAIVVRAIRPSSDLQLVQCPNLDTPIRPMNEAIHNGITSTNMV